MKREDVAIIRLEQIGPFPYNAFEKVIKNYGKNAEIIWLSEEPENFGAWTYIKPRADLVLSTIGRNEIEYRGRPISSTTASGYSSEHKEELATLLKEAFE